ncbi:MAG: YdeI/OmpD-associated family protein [Bacteroidales bacterium]|nr:YdeI/OmpD-associated family protein [Bacteroidales bacterium]
MKDQRLDKYIAAFADFAKPVLNHLRALVHQACPEVEEKLKWGFPHFDYKGVYTSMAGFKEHCAFTFWKAKIMADPHKLLGEKEEKAMGHFGRIRSLKDLPPDEILLEYLLEAKRLNDKGIKVTQKKPTEKEKKELVVPDDLLLALKQNIGAVEIFEKFPYSRRKEYIMWITEAKTEATREKRIATAVEWIGEGKSRNWKYK